MKFTVTQDCTVGEIHNQTTSTAELEDTATPEQIEAALKGLLGNLEATNDRGPGA